LFDDLQLVGGKNIKMGLLWSRCCDSDEDAADAAAYGVNNESLLLTRSASMSGDWTGSHSPEEGRSNPFSVVKASYAQFVQMPKLVPATAEEEREYMVRSYSSGTLFDIQPECLLCLDAFSETRPTALSLCACGVNKNTFHLECLLEWRKKTGKANCPVCDNELFFDQAASAAAAAAARVAESKASDVD
jgi:hypothetical protein